MRERVTQAMNVVLLTGSAGWRDDVCGQAQAMGLRSIHTARSAREAIARLAAGTVSHLLLQPQSAGDLLPELVDMTAGQPSGVALVVLGEPDRLPRHPSADCMTFVPVPTQGWLQRVLAPSPAFQLRSAHDAVAAGSGGHASQDAALSVQELQDALFDARIQTRYQPIVRLDNGLPVGLEVLARLEHPQRGILQPDLFVPQIEASGLAWPLTEAVITRAFADWGDGKLGSFGLTLAVNFPLDVLIIPEALTWLETHRRRAGLPAERIVIELTESRPVTELARLRHAISTLRGIGYGLAIDDVGPELRDHQALLDLQFTALKLDKDLVRESPDSASANAFLMQTITAAREANLTIVAEGVEDEDIWRRMQRLGVDQAQGFLVARPLPAAAVPLWHSDWCSRLGR